MAHTNYEGAKKAVYRGLILLAIVTLAEVMVSLFGKGHIISGIENQRMIVYGAGLLIIILSIYKAYYIIYEFMHMGHEVPGLRMSVLLPTALLIWGMVAFFQEGDSWGDRREQIKEKDELEVEETIKVQQGMYLKEELPINLL